MKLIVGLGNPGARYEKTRHNVGFVVLDELASNMRKKHGLISQTGEKWEVSQKFDSLITSYDSHLILSKPQTFMNDSGKAVAKLANFYNIEISDIWVIHDDLDIKLGQYKIQNGVGPKVHNGVNSVEKLIGKDNFWRIRVGVDNRLSEGRIDGESYVLQKFTNGEREMLKSVIDEVVDVLVNKLTINHQ